MSRCVLALALAIPATAHPLSLSQLLRLPLEQLLLLEFSASAAKPGPRGRVQHALLAARDGRHT